MTVYEDKLDTRAMTPWELLQPAFKLIEKSKNPPEHKQLALCGLAFAARLLEVLESGGKELGEVSDRLCDVSNTLDRIEAKKK